MVAEPGDRLHHHPSLEIQYGERTWASVLSDQIPIILFLLVC